MLRGQYKDEERLLKKEYPVWMKLKHIRRRAVELRYIGWLQKRTEILAQHSRHAT